MTKKCLGCQIEFETIYPDKVYCTRQCGKRAGDRRRDAVEKLDLHPGDRHGRLILIRPAENTIGRAKWVANCDCRPDREVYVRTDKLQVGRAKSCGCIREDLAKTSAQKKKQLEQQNREQQQKRLLDLEQRLVELRAEEAKWKPVCVFGKREDTQEMRHDAIKKLLHYRQTPRTDPLWSIRYFNAVTADNECYYCRGCLDARGTSIDFFKHSDFYAAWNILFVCRSCREKKNSFYPLTVEEMEIVGRILELIRLRRLNASTTNEYPLQSEAEESFNPLDQPRAA
jgi:hypothetical protein